MFYRNWLKTVRIRVLKDQKKCYKLIPKSHILGELAKSHKIQNFGKWRKNGTKSPIQKNAAKWRKIGAFYRNCLIKSRNEGFEKWPISDLKSTIYEKPAKWCQLRTFYKNRLKNHKNQRSEKTAKMVQNRRILKMPQSHTEIDHFTKPG